MKALSRRCFPVAKWAKMESAMKILAVDDDPFILKLLEQIITAIGQHSMIYTFPLVPLFS